MEIDYSEIGRRIAKRRKELGLKQSEVCEKCNLSDKYLSVIECSKSIPSLEVLMKICIALDTTPDFLLIGAQTRSPSNLEYAISHKLSSLSSEKLSLVSSFIDWISEQSFE
ncbi:MAG: helix-turn-helix transcriptional regulator [Clostridia bacterium]|nr:helix-turn-helix transcriptional regulator [Clostridia bacterium]